MKVKRASSGLYYRNLGYQLPDYWRQFPGRTEWVKMSGTATPRTVRPHPERSTQPKFYLGRDERTAVVAAGRLEQLWEQVEARWREQSSMQWYDPDTESLYTVELDRPYWDEVTLQIAEAVRTHQPVARLSLPSYLAGHFHRPSDVTDWLADLRERFPVVALELADAGLAADGRADTEQRARRHQRRAKSLLRTVSPQRLHPALDAYRQWVGTKYVELDGRPSQWAGAKVRQIGFLLATVADMPLSDFDTPQIDALLDAIRRRPPGKRSGQPIAVKTANNVIKEVRQFVRWLHRSPEWDWTKPLDYEVMPVRVVTTPDERAGRAHQVKTYTVGELRLLWRYANPVERLLIALGLNCGFGRAEAATLRLDEVRLHARNPVLRPDEHDDGGTGDESWVVRLRGKTGVFGVWRLWPVTVRAVEWWLYARPRSDSPHLFVTRRGESFAKPTTGGRQNSRVANLWKSLTERVRKEKDLTEFPVLSYGKLRKTGASLVRRHGGGEAASLYLSHGVAFQGDDLLEVYSDRPFQTMFSALDVVNDQLESVWADVTDPFPATVLKGGPNITRGTIRRIVELHDGGLPVGRIAEEVGVSRETVRRWLQRHGKRHKRGERHADHPADASGGRPGGLTPESEG